MDLLVVVAFLSFFVLFGLFLLELVDMCHRFLRHRQRKINILIIRHPTKYIRNRNLNKAINILILLFPYPSSVFNTDDLNSDFEEMIDDGEEYLLIPLLLRSIKIVPQPYRKWPMIHLD